MTKDLLTINQTVSVNIRTHKDKGKLAKRLKCYPILVDAMTKMQAGKGDGITVNSFSVLHVAETFDAINSRFPGDSFDLSTIVGLLDGSVMFDKDENDILVQLLPEFFSHGNLHTKVRGGNGHLSVEFQFSPKKSGGYYTVKFSHVETNVNNAFLGFPLKVEVEVYADMDDLSNHGEGCPMCEADYLATLVEDPKTSEEDRAKYEKELEEVAGADCNCETFIEFSNSLEVSDKSFNAKNGKKRLADWLEKAICKDLSKKGK